MQQRGTNGGDMEAESEGQSSPTQTRRNTAKPKVLVRSHAMREEASPPREPTPTPHISPCIQLVPSPISSPIQTKPMVVLSPSISRGNSPCRSPMCASPTSTLVPSPASRCSPQSVSSQNATDNSDTARLRVDGESNYDRNTSPKYLNRLNRQNLERDGKVPVKTEIIVEEPSQYNRRKPDKSACDCSNPNCIKCLKGQERNINNNLSNNVNNNMVANPNTLSVGRPGAKNKLRHQGSSQSSFDGSVTNSPCLSRDSSSEQYTDTTGIDLDLFIPETLNKNAKDRALMLRIEQELVNLAKDKVKSHFKFPPMSSYQRMLVHRCAAYFGMDHNIESSGKCVVVNKTKNTRIPEIEFKEHIKEDIVFTEEPRRSILKRDSNSMEDYGFKSPDRQYSLESRRSKSFEEREEEYEKVRRRIFNREFHDGNSTDEFVWSEVPWSSTDSDNSSRFKLLPPDQHYKHPARLLKVQSEEAGDTMRPCVAKSYSFGGYGGVSVLTRGDSVMSTHSAGPRLFTKQDSAASSVSWRLSPSSSGYKSQSQRSESVTPSPVSTPYPSSETLRQDSLFSEAPSQQSLSKHQDTQLVWAVTDIHNVPKGSIIINPQTGEPFKNEDGSLYHYDPTNPPVSYCSEGTRQFSSPHKTVITSPQKSIKERPPSPSKRRPRSSPSKKSNLINSSTSPSLPFTPPLLQSRTSSFPPAGENIQMVPQQYPAFSNCFAGPQQEGSLQMYQQPCIVYAPYSVPVPAQYESRIESQIPTDIPSGGYIVNIPDNNLSQPLAYQSAPPVWNQHPITFYQSPPPSTSTPQSHRFSFPVQGQAGFVHTSYPSNYLPHSSQNQNQELVPVYTQQPVQVIYPSGPTQQSPVMYPNQPPVLYTTQNPIFPNSVYPAPPPVMQQSVPHYPHNTSTPNSCTSSVSNTPYCRQEMPPMPQAGFTQITAGMNQLNLNPNQSLAGAGGYPYAQNHKVPQQFDSRQKTGTPKGSKFSNPKSFGVCSNQGSTGTNSPATTVVAGYCGNPGMYYRTPSETPPIQNVAAFGYGGNFAPPMLYRQASNVSTTATNRSSRSPTPASELDKQRIPMPPTVYQGMPYVLQSDNRIIPGRGQPISYRQGMPDQPVLNTGSELNKFSAHRCTKGRKMRGKMTGLPPSGKQCM